MGTPRARAFGLLLSLALGACGGGGGGPPKPLKRHFDEMQFLGGIPVDQRQDELDAKGQYDRALMEQAKAKSDYDESKVLLDVAKNERAAAKLDEKSAETRQKAAKSSADTNRIKEAESEMQGARLAADAADKRFSYISAYRGWLLKLMRYTEHNTYWKESVYELAQAKIAQKNTIAPKGFNFDNFVKQESDRKKKTADAKAKAENEKKDATGFRTKWLALQKQSDKLLGKTSEYPDPLDPSKVQGSDIPGYSPGGDGMDSDKEIQPTQDPTMKDPSPPPPDGKGGGDDPDAPDEGDDEDQADSDEGGE
jgi:hypothetical protein